MTLHNLSPHQMYFPSLTHALSRCWTVSQHSKRKQTPAAKHMLWANELTTGQNQKKTAKGGQLLPVS